VTLPHTLKRIRLNLARSKQFPSGSVRHGYEFVAPLDAVGHIDPLLWHQHRDRCRVRRFWQGEDDQVGRLVHKPGGAEHARWVFDYDPESVEDDEAGSLRRAQVRAWRICLDSRRRRRAAYLSGGVG
jgi:hypothetical protein